jgi:hypothetical protein
MPVVMRLREGDGELGSLGYVVSINQNPNQVKPNQTNKKTKNVRKYESIFS